MSLWRRKALEAFPDLHRMIADADGVHEVWFELTHRLEETYRHEPLDERFVGRVYGYAAWCLYQRSDEIRTAVVLDFYEHLPEEPALRRDMARWLSEETFEVLDFAWRYVLKDGKELAAFQQEFRDQKRSLAAARNASHRTR